MAQNAIEDAQTNSTFLAILRTTEHVKQIQITEDEYLALKRLRQMRVEQKHTPVQFGYWDGKLHCYDVVPNFTTLAK